MYKLLTILTLCCILLGGCGGKEEQIFTGKTYPATKPLFATFLYKQVPKQCRVFAHTLVSLPEGLSGQEIKNTVFQEAGSKGANLVLVGQTRIMDDDNDEASFQYYGPEKRVFLFNPMGWLGIWL